MGTIVAVATYLRGRVKVLVTYHVAPLELPRTVWDVIELGQQTVYGRTQASFQAAALPAQVNVLLDRFASVATLGALRVPTRVVTASVTNRGHEAVEGARLACEGAHIARIAERDHDIPLRGSIDLPEIRPGETLRLTLWCSAYPDRVDLLLRKGRPRVLQLVLVTPRWASLSRTWWLDLMGLVLVAFLLAAIIASLKTGGVQDP